MDYKLHPNAIKHAIDLLFSKRNRLTESIPTDSPILIYQNNEKDEWVFQPIDTRDPKALQDLAKNRLNDFLQNHPDNSIDLFIETEIDRAKGYQSYFNNYKSDREHKEYFFKLDRWIKAIEKLNTTQLHPTTFEGVFYHPELMQKCVDVLKTVDPPLIDTDCNYIGKSKGAIVVWWDRLQKQALIKKVTDRKIKKSIVEGLIKNFSIDDTNFDKIGERAKKNYQIQIDDALSNIKLSQNSDLKKRES